MTENLGIKWAFILALLALTGWLFFGGKETPIKLGIDLRGGKAITYTIDKKAIEQLPLEQRATALRDTIDTISRRIDALGVKELTIRQVGDDMIVIEAPHMTDEELGRIQAQMMALGNLEFLIKITGAGSEKIGTTFDIPGERADEFQKYTFDAAQADAQRKAAYESAKTLLGQSYRDGEPYHLIDATGATPKQLPFVWMPHRSEVGSPSDEALKKSLANAPDVDHSKIYGDWLYKDPRFFGGNKPGFSGRDISSVRRSNDAKQQRAVAYDMDSVRASEFEEYTGAHLNQPMALCLNETIWSAPVIQSPLRDTVEIHNNTGFSAEEQNMLVNCLQSGSLRLKPRQAHVEEIGPALGKLAIQRGTISTIISFILIIGFMIWYYRVSGIVANIALILNLVFILATMALFQATLSLPGIAGIILSIGMGVDANILVFERTREELQKGKNLLAALDAGYKGAFSAIFDGNVTSGIAAALLIGFGTGPIKGFGITLLAGLIIQLFTALFVTKAVFGLLIAKGWLKKMTFIDVMKPKNYDWIGRARPWQYAAGFFVVFALGMFIAEGDSKYGVDFTGGTVAKVRFAAAVDAAEVRDTIFSIKAPDGSRKFEEVDAIARDNAPGATGSKSTEFDVKLRTTKETDTEDVKNFMQGHLARMFPDKLEGVTTVTPAPKAPGEWTADFRFKEPVPVVDIRTTIDQYKDENANRPFAGSLVTPVDSVTDPDDLDAVAKAQHYKIELTRQDVDAGSAVADLRRAFAGKLAAEAPFEGVNYLGPNVVASLKESAIVSMLFALGAIILYLWFRFKEVKFGIAAVVALIHDVMVPLGLGIFLHKIGVLNVPLNLQSIAAFLTIIGYQVNDTIVVFDRVRENVGNIKGSFRHIVNVSINQTLNRTILTTSAVFAVIAVLFFVNIGQDSPLEGLAFILLVGTIAGSLSTIFVACPLAVWLHEREERRKAAAGQHPQKTAPVSTAVAS